MPSETCGICSHPRHEGIRCPVPQVKEETLNGWVFERIVGRCQCGLLDETLRNLEIHYTITIGPLVPEDET